MGEATARYMDTSSKGAPVASMASAAYRAKLNARLTKAPGDTGEVDAEVAAAALRGGPCGVDAKIIDRPLSPMSRAEAEIERAGENGLTENTRALLNDLSPRRSSSTKKKKKKKKKKQSHKHQAKSSRKLRKRRNSIDLLDQVCNWMSPMKSSTSPLTPLGSHNVRGDVSPLLDCSPLVSQSPHGSPKIE